MPPLRDFEYTFRDWKNAEGRCQVRIFAGTEASSGLPVVMVTEPNDNAGPSVTNAMETLAPELLSRYLPEQDGLEPPFVLVEHYPDHQFDAAGAQRHDPFLGETFDLVSFEHWRSRPRWQGPRRGMMQSFGEPQWRRTTRGDVERLIGEPLPWLSCTCQLPR